MQKNLLWIIIGAVLVILVGVFITYNNFSKTETSTDDTILFYGNDCPHCKIVDDFITQNKVEDKVKFTKLEVFDNKSNSNLLLKKAQICGLDTNQVGVPFLWDNGKCFMGDPDVIKFFQDKINQSN